MPNALPEDMVRVSYVEDKLNATVLRMLSMSGKHASERKIGVSPLIRDAVAEFIESRDPDGRIREQARQLLDNPTYGPPVIAPSKSST